MKKIIVLTFVLIALSFAFFADDYSPYVEKFSNGEINWQEGFVVARGKGLIPDSGDVAMAMRAADVDARGNLVKIMNGIRFDGDSFIGDRSDALIRLKGFIRGAEKIGGKKNGKFYEVELKAPIKGVTGLSSELINLASNNKMPNNALARASFEKLADNQSVIVIDARKTGLNPALFPVIKSADGKVIYSKDMVNKDSILKNGMMSYVTGDEILQAMFKDMNCIVVQTQTKKKRRRGYQTIKVKSSDSDGKLKANIVVSAEDAKKLVKADKESGALRKCRVVVVMDSEIGGIEGRFFGNREKPFALVAGK